MLKLAVLLFMALFLTGAACNPDRPADPGNVLAVTECPEKLSPVADESFGETVKKAIEWANQYHRCRRAALGQQKPAKE